MNRLRCFHAPLAKNGMGKMDYCAACGVVTLHIGAISLRFDPESAETIQTLLSDGLTALREEMAAERVHTTNKMMS
ncbi:MAG: hypothetical protein IPM54_25945 [Polyangiaceae bacterium]|nr:hypothetical protein [Polyangiaceae bacterium]